MLLTKQEIVNAQDTKTQDIDVPEWGGTVRVKALSARERDAFEASLVAGEGKKRKVDVVNIRAKLVGLCLIDEAGARLFTDDEVRFLGAKSAAAMDRIFTICQRLAGLTAEDVDELEKKSGAVLNGSSSSTSVSHSADSPIPMNSSTDSRPSN